MLTKNQSHHLGHQKVKNKFIKDASSLSDYELLELLLLFTLPNQDIRTLAKKLLADFGSISSLVKADIKFLKNLPYINENLLISLKMVKEIIIRSSKDEIIRKPIISSWQQLCNYCKIVMTNLKEEQFRVLFLDKQCHLICDQLIKNGNIDKVDIDPQIIVTQSLNFFAQSVILLHNHPGDNCQPSKEDIINTKRIFNALKTIDVKIYDHLIIGKNGQLFSFKSEGLLKN